MSDDSEQTVASGSHEIAERQVHLGSLDVRLRAYPAGYTQREHEHDETIVNIVLCGTVEEATGQDASRADAWAFYVRPPGVRHANRYENGTTRVLTIKCRDGEISPSSERAGFLLDLGRLRLVITLLRKIHGRSTNGKERIPSALDLLISAQDGRSWPASDREGIARQRVEDARAKLTAPEAPRVRDAAMLAGMHRVAFARSFRRLYGVSPSEYRRWDRVRRAASHLGQATIPLSDVALEAGFADQSHMCRDFRRILGLTPMAYRRLIDPDALSPAQTPSDWPVSFIQYGWADACLKCGACKFVLAEIAG